MMPLLGIAGLTMGEDPPLDEQPLVPALVPALPILIGLLIPGVAVPNTWQVRQDLSASSKR